MHDPNENRPGYKKTKVEWIPEEWRLTRVGKLLAFKNGLNKGKEAFGTGIPILNYTDVYNRRSFQQADLKGKVQVTNSELKNHSVCSGDVFFTRTSETPQDIGLNAVALGDFDKVVFSGFLLRGRPVSDKLNQNFTAYCFSSVQVRREIIRKSSYTTRALTNGKFLSEVIIPLPPLPEQKKIADILSTWDNAIDYLRKLIEAKKRQKKGLMQQLLTGNKRLPGFGQGQEKIQTIMGEWPSDWPLADLLAVFSKVKRKNTNGINRVLTASGENGLIDQQTYFNKSVAGADLSAYYHLKKGEFAYNRSSMGGYPYGAIKRLDLYNDGVLSILYACFALRPNAGDSDYYNHLFESGLLNSQLRRLVQVGGRAHGLLNITDGDFFGLKIPRPSLAEQTAIAKVLDAADREIRTLESKLAALERQKKGLMQRLLTGQIRVNV